MSDAAPNPVPRYSAELAAGLSVIPGLGHLYVGKHRKGLSLLIIDAGIVLAVLFSKSTVISLLVFMLYLIIMIPAVADTFCYVKGQVSRFAESRSYLVLLLLVKGFWALPLLWQSRVFSKRAKIAWTIAVPALAIAYFTLIVLYGRLALEYAEAWLG